MVQRPTTLVAPLHAALTPVARAVTAQRAVTHHAMGVEGLKNEEFVGILGA